MRLKETLARFEDLRYPITADELVERIGDEEVDLQNGTETIADVMDRLEVDRFTDPNDAHAAFMSGLGEGAIGRKAYGDRDPPLSGTGRDPRSVRDLLEGEDRFDAGGPHCGICEYVKLVGDWDVAAFCTKKGELLEGVEVGDVCGEYRASS
ncbi:MAG: hypothetical protein ABEJ71_00715 [Halodesulfurarchaeum sp.]